jgi:hypothetical protein
LLIAPHMGKAIIFLWLGGCVSSEFALSRQGRIAGDVASGGIGWVGTSTVHREDGVQNGSVGMSFQYLQQSPEGEGAFALGADARYARQLTSSRRWRGYGRASVGLAPCDLKDCGEREMEAASGRVLGVAIGVERFVWVPAAEDPRDSGWFSTSLGVVYTRSTHETLGDGDFVGVELGMRVGVNLFADRAGAEP